jgi:hypothetical protein
MDRNMYHDKGEQELTGGGVFCQECGTDQSTEPKKEQSRVVELLLGLFGGISGLFGAFLVIGMGRLGEASEVPEASDFIVLGYAAIVFSIIGIIGAVLVMSKTKTAGWLMIISAYGGLISTSFSFLLPFMLVLFGGIKTLRDS